MSRPLVGVLAGLLFAPVGAGADALVYTTQTPVGGAKGLVIDRPAGEPYAAGISWLYQGSPVWEQGLDITFDYPGNPDLVLAENPATQCDNLRIRSDDARTALGPRVGHPVLPFQLSLEPGAMNGGLAVGTSGYQWSAYLYNRDDGNNEAAVCYDGLWLVGSDLHHAGATDFSFWSFGGGTVLSLGEAGGLGFFGTAPTAKPTVSGSWTDGSAARSTLAALVQLGLVADTTTP